MSNDSQCRIVLPNVAFIYVFFKPIIFLNNLPKIYKIIYKLSIEFCCAEISQQIIIIILLCNT